MQNIADYVKYYTREERTKHINLKSPCIKPVYGKSGSWGNKGEVIKTKAGQKQKARVALSEYLGLVGKTDKYNHLCHLCPNDSGTLEICVNPEHLYFGTASENQLDISEEVRKETQLKRSRAGIKSQLEKGTHVSQTEEGIKTSRKTMKKIQDKLFSEGKHINQLGKSGFQRKETCPHCGKEGMLANMRRWHFDNCKSIVVET